ncbi:MAG: lysostaphin resistance A-like protein [Alphaproteobacteria bacterium]
MASSKNKSIMRVVEGFALLVICHWLANKFLTFTLVKIAPGFPWITASMMVATLSPVIASIYMFLRTRYVPPLFVKTQTLVAIIASAILAWLVLFLEALFLGTKMSLAQEMIQAQSHLHLMLFLLIVWGPLWEETLYRGYFFETLKQIWGGTLALLFSSVLFTGFHGIFIFIYEGSIGYDLVFIFITSLVFTLAYVQGGLTAAVATHAFVNFYLMYLNL